ncbi:hypothetical protein GCM10027295_15910 [Pseudaeromonas pectinilytica]
MGLDNDDAVRRFSDPQVQQLVRAAQSGDVATINELVAAGVDVNAQGEENTTPLIWAMTAHSYRGVEALLAHGANPNQRYEHGYTPLWFAAGGNDLTLLEMLLKKGGDPNIWVDRNMNPLMFAIEQDRIDNYRMLLNYGANINNVNELHNGIAVYAVAIGNFELAYEILMSGYKTELEDFSRSVYIRQISTDSDQYPYKEKVITFLKAKGIAYPPPPQPPAESKIKLNADYRQKLEALDKEGKLPIGSRGREILDHDRKLDNDSEAVTAQ